MVKHILRSAALAVAACALAATAFAQEVDFKDPTGDDNGPGTYTYPTDPVYKPGSFDITGVKITQKGDKVTFAVSVNSDIENPWAMPDPANFSVQMIFIHVNTGKGAITKGVPGTNVQFAKGNGWDRVVVLSPQPAGRVKAEFRDKAADLLPALVVPEDTTAEGRTIHGTVDLKAMGGGSVTKWRYQVLMQSNEGFPDKHDVLTRKVNEYEGQHRFGGGNDGDCDPHVMDLLAGKAVGDKGEIDAQHKMLAYQCNPDGTSKKPATLTLVSPPKKK
ncbi:glucodextranase DOMON-like domain-containing protein [Anaeromyxobacter oryzae]|uniref:Pullulanase n=1 Tax=Anaeromyxobacter oryzae TaxID=2918170 RepID=A0ABM7WUS0_9BACT|nr:glucodextranase DOMON-like domain-containing protein [Anaeromyxobacter oryzae]BDG03242.1 pullulanase [Anaeromyxobacter oryzae]